MQNSACPRDPLPRRQWVPEAIGCCSIEVTTQWDGVAVPLIPTAIMLNSFRDRHPMGSLNTDLLRVEEGIFVVKAQVVVNNTILGTGIAGSTTVEEAEDAALKRALNHAGFSSTYLSLGSDIKPSTSLPLGSLSATPVPRSPAPNGGRTGTESTQLGSGAADMEAEIPFEETYSSFSPGEPQLPDPPPEPEDLSDIIAQTDVQLRRIGWSAKEGREFLEQRFNKKSRHQLNEAELREFLRHLKQQPARSARQESPF